MPDAGERICVPPPICCLCKARTIFSSLMDCGRQWWSCILQSRIFHQIFYDFLVQYTLVVWESKQSTFIHTFHRYDHLHMGIFHYLKVPPLTGKNETGMSDLPQKHPQKTFSPNPGSINSIQPTWVCRKTSSNLVFNHFSSHFNGNFWGPWSSLAGFFSMGASCQNHWCNGSSSWNGSRIFTTMNMCWEAQYFWNQLHQ